MKNDEVLHVGNNISNNIQYSRMSYAVAKCHLTKATAAASILSLAFVTPLTVHTASKYEFAAELGKPKPFPFVWR
jgi:hypothetical protein